jgi:hypothetical protein
MEGTFDADVIGGTLTQAKTGTAQVAVEFRLADGSRVTDYMPVTERALKYTVEKLRACGWTGDDLEQLASIQGARVELVLRQEEYEGRPRTKVAFVNKPGEGGPKPAPSGTGQQWRERIRALAGESDGSPF